MDASLGGLLARLEHAAATWHDQPMRRVVARNRPLRPLRRRQFHSFGDRSLVDRPAWLYGTHHIAIGTGVIVLRGAWLSAESVGWDRPAPTLTIGNGCWIRIGGTISAAESIMLEEDVICGAYVTIVDSAHTWTSGHPNTIYSPLRTKPVRIGQGTWLADRATVTAGSDIGVQCAIGAGAVVRGTIPDYSIVVGNPGKVVGSTKS